MQFVSIFSFFYLGLPAGNVTDEAEEEEEAWQLSW